jgi:uncharacterized protein YcgI (DUF1989 family)
MKAKLSETIAHNTGRAYLVEKDQVIRIEGTTIVDFVVFNHANLNERFDQARTKATQQKIFLSTGDYLVSRADRPMMRILEDTFSEGTHDLDKGMCSASGYRYRLTKKGALDKRDERAVQEVPDHGCWENLIDALLPWKIRPEDIPNPFNIFMTMEIDGESGKLAITKARPHHPAHMDFQAQIDCVVGISACPDTIVGGKAVNVMILED